MLNNHLDAVKYRIVLTNSCNKYIYLPIKNKPINIMNYPKLFKFPILLSILILTLGCDRTKNNEAELKRLVFNINNKDYVATHKAEQWQVELPSNADLSKLPSPTIGVSRKATYSPISQTDFSSPVTYTVTAEDQTQRQYTLVVSKNTPSAKAQILSILFELNNTQLKAVQSTPTQWNITLPSGVNLSKLSSPKIALSTGATISPSAQTDFSQPVTYTLTAADGSKTQHTLTVTSQSQASNAKEIVSIRFTIDGKTYSAGSQDKTSWGARLPWSVNLAAIPQPPHIVVSPGADFSPKNQTDFSQPVTYTITAADKSTRQITLGLGKAPWAQPDNANADSEKEVVALFFNISGKSYIGTVDNKTKTIQVSLPSNTTLSNLPSPIIQVSQNATIDKANQTDFSSPVTYTVTAKDGSKQTYTLTVSKPQNQPITLDEVKFTIGAKEYLGVLTGQHYNVTLPAGTDKSNLPTPSFKKTPTHATINNPGTTNFTDPVNYTLTDGQNQTAYTVVVNVAKAPTNANTDFVMTWKTTSADQWIKLPLYRGGDYNFQVDWGDGSTSQINNTNLLSESLHKYTSPGTHEVRIKGKLEGFTFTIFSNTSYAPMLTEIKQWGNMKLAPASEGDNTAGTYLSGCDNLVISASDQPDFTGITSLFGMFYNAKGFNSNISHWDLTGIKNVGAMFLGASAFNQNLSQWKIPNVNKCNSFSSNSALTPANKPNFSGKCSE